MSHFCGLYDDLHLLSLHVHGPQNGRCGKVVIPQIVMHGLEMPEAFASHGIQR